MSTAADGRCKHGGYRKGSGLVIELDEPLDLNNGQEVEVEVHKRTTHFRKGSPQALLSAVLAPPHLTYEDVDALERAIEEGKTPIRDEGIFDDLR